MNGLYALKPWYADRLGGLRRALVRNHVPPALISAGGVAFGAAAGVGLLFPPGPVSAIAVGIALAARLACANLDGGVARTAGRTSRFGVVTNELADRLAELAALAGTLALAPVSLVAAAALAASSPSWVSLTGAAAGAPRLQGGPVGKTERCLILIAIAATGWAVPMLVMLGAGSAVTALLRVGRLHRMLARS